MAAIGGGRFRHTPAASCERMDKSQGSGDGTSAVKHLLRLALGRALQRAPWVLELGGEADRATDGAHRAAKRGRFLAPLLYGKSGAGTVGAGGCLLPRRPLAAEPYWAPGQHEEHVPGGPVMAQVQGDPPLYEHVQVEPAQLACQVLPVLS
jgi:hypothetical protein